LSALWFIPFLAQFLPYAGQPLLHPCFLDLGERHPVHAWSAAVSLGQLIGMFEDVLAANLAVQKIKAVFRLRLRFDLRSSSASCGSAPLNALKQRVVR
jgi:hypothetical protein